MTVLPLRDRFTQFTDGGSITKLAMRFLVVGLIVLSASDLALASAAAMFPGNIQMAGSLGLLGLIFASTAMCLAYVHDTTDKD